MRLKECFEKGLLRKSAPDKRKALRSVQVAKNKMREAERLFGADFWNQTILAVYTAMFHAARALLYKDGIKERSHYGLYVYLREKYRDRLEFRFINELNVLREERHELMYGLEVEKHGEEEAQGLLKVCGAFIKAVEKLV